MQKEAILIVLPTNHHYLVSVILQHKAFSALTMTLQLPDCALWWSHCKMALISKLCECVGNRAAFPVL